MSELACMRAVIIFETSKHSFCAYSYKTSVGLMHACINLSCSEKLCFRGSQTRLHNACMSDRMMKYVLLRWAPSLKDRSKLKGHYTDVKSGCVTSVPVGPSLNPNSLFKKNSTVPLSLKKLALLKNTRIADK